MYKIGFVRRTAVDNRKTNMKSFMHTCFGSSTYRFANWIILRFAFSRFSDYIHPPRLGILFDKR